MYTLYVFSKILVCFSMVSKSGSQYDEKIHQIVQYSLSNKLPHYLKNKILDFFRYKFQKRFFDEQKINNGMSSHLQHELKMHHFYNLMISLNWYSFLTVQAAEDILLQTEQEYFLPNDVIMQPGKKIPFIYFIKSGNAVVRDRKGNELMHYNDGNAVGMISLLWNRDKISIFSVVVIEMMETWKLSTEQMIQVFQQYPLLLKYCEDNCKGFIALWHDILAEDFTKSHITKLLGGGGWTIVVVA